MSLFQNWKSVRFHPCRSVPLAFLCSGKWPSDRFWTIQNERRPWPCVDQFDDQCCLMDYLHKYAFPLMEGDVVMAGPDRC